MTASTTSALHLVGGGWLPAAAAAVYGGFLAAAGPAPDIACVVVDEGDGLARYGRGAAALRSVAPCTPAAVLVPAGDALRAEDLDEVGVQHGLGLVPYAVAQCSTP